jgi:mono/diheme cytochrome c family protein
MEYDHRRRRLTCALVGFGLLTALAGSSRAADTVDGRKLYLKYCSACHGESGKGDGVVSQSMRPHPIDLTQLAKKAGGSFPAADIAGRIDGRETSRFHGDPDMPIWGEILRDPSATGKAAEQSATSKVVLIRDYLKTIQEK